LPAPAPAVDRAPRVGFFGGVGAFFAGVGFVVGTPGVWLLALVPVATAIALALVTLAVGTVLGLDAARALAPEHAWLLRVVFVVAAGLAALLVAVTLAQPLSGWALDRIVLRRELALGRQPPPRSHVPWFVALPRALGVNLLGLAFGLPLLGLLFAVSLLFPPAALVCLPLKVLVGGLVMAWDFLDYSMALRAIGIGPRLAWIGRHLGAVLGFAMGAGVFLFTPGLGLLVLPMGVAGAATLMSRVEGEQ
jgi:CysZ protein